MIIIIVFLIFGWLLNFIGLDTMLHYMVGFDRKQYYLLFLIMGLLVWVSRLFRLRR